MKKEIKCDDMHAGVSLITCRRWEGAGKWEILPQPVRLKHTEHQDLTSSLQFAFGVRIPSSVEEEKEHHISVTEDM